MTKFVIAFCALALVAAFAGTVPAVAHVTLTRPVEMAGNAMPAGDYRLLIGENKVTFMINRKSFEVPAKIEEAPKKFSTTEVSYDGSSAKLAVHEITIGGTKTRLTFN